MISIVVPVYNSEIYLSECIESILSQTYRDIEIILVEDGSKDNSLAVCRRYSAQDSRIRIFPQDNRGVSEARNRGLREARGEYVQFVDSDDRLEPQMCQILLENMENNQSDLVICGIRMISGGKVKAIYSFPEKRILSDWNDLRESFTDLYCASLLHSPVNKLYRKERIRDNFESGIDFGEDLIFNLAYFENVERISVVPEVLYNYVRINENSLATKYREDKCDAILYCNQKVIEFCNKRFGAGFDFSLLERTFYQIFVNDYIGHIQEIVYLPGLSAQEKQKKIREILAKEQGAFLLHKAVSWKKVLRLDRKIAVKLALKHRVFGLYIFFRIKFWLAGCLGRR